ncbi:MAG TPA: PIN domain-containing protein [Thermoanaerobaculia bacterium]|nr:PIN domain-containing protein [Thermoanaerobaculia bacterium]
MSPASLWEEQLISSRLLQYEVWARIHAYKLTESHSEAVTALLQRVALVEMVLAVLARALEPFPRPVRTFDALHLASADFIRSQGEAVSIASYDDRLLGAARELGFVIAKV